MNWNQLLLDLAASPLAITFYCALTLFVWRFLKIRFQWDTERWEGMLAAAFNAAEKSGILGGESKLAYALNVFARLHAETYGKPASPADLKDAALDLARYAYELKLNTPAAPLPAGTPTAGN